MVFTWLSNNTGASLLLVILLHGSVDGTATYLQVLADRGVIPADAAAFSVEFGVLIVAVLTALALIALTRGASDGENAAMRVIRAAVVLCAVTAAPAAQAAPDGGCRR